MTDANSMERRVEATKALNLLGVHDIYWECLPFYRRNDRSMGSDDVRTTIRLLEHAQPDYSAVCYDADPHQTHVKCTTVDANETAMPSLWCDFVGP